MTINLSFLFTYNMINIIMTCLKQVLFQIYQFLHHNERIIMGQVFVVSKGGGFVHCKRSLPVQLL